MAIIKVDILNHADYYAAYLRNKDYSGLSQFYGAIESVRSINPEHTLLLDAGDNFKHLLWDDDVQDGIIMLKTDVYGFGNHDFDKGQKHLEKGIERLKGQVEVVCSNVIEKATGNLVKGAKPYVIYPKGGIKYGILGLITEYTPFMVTKKYFEPFKVLNSVECCRKYIPEMRQKGAEVIILLTHFPFYFTQDSQSGEAIEVLDQIADLKPDVLIGGHIPGDFGRVYKGCAVGKAGFGGKSLSHITLYFDDEKREVVDREASIIDVYNGNYPDDPEIVGFVEKVCKPYDYFYHEEIGYVPEKINMRLDFESGMGNLLADMLMWRFKPDFVYFNNTSCGRGLEAGKMTRSKIVDITHFNDDLYTAVYTGQMIWDLFELVSDPIVFGNNANISFAGFNVVMDHTKPAGNKVVSITQLDGTPLDLNKQYTVLTSEYMSSGGNGTRKITSKVDWKDTNVLMYDALADYIIAHKEVKAPKLGRYKFIGTPENDNSPW